MKTQFVTFVVIFALLGLASTQTAGVSTAIQKSFLDDVKNDVLPKFLSQLESIPFPPISFSTGAWIFKETYTISGIQFTKLDVNPADATLTLASPNEAQISVPNVTMDANFTYNTDGVFNEDGTGSFGITGTSMSFTMTIGRNGEEPSASISSANVDMGDLSIDISAGWILKIASWFANTFSGLFKGVFESAINSAITSKGNAALSAMLATFPISETIPGTTIAVSYGVVSDPIVTSDDVEVSVAGIVYDTTTGTDLPIAPAVSMPAYLPDGLEFQAFVSEFTVNSALYTATESGMATISIDQAMIPSTIPVALNTNTLNAIFPGLTDKYGYGQNCTLTLALASPVSSASVTTAGITLTADTDMTVAVGDATAIEIQMVADFEGSVSVKGTTMYPTLTNANVQSLKVVSTTIPDFDTAEATENLNALVDLVKMGADALVLAQGLRLPTVDGVDLTDSLVTLNTGYLTLESSPDFSGVTNMILAAALEVELAPQEFETVQVETPQGDFIN